MTDRVPLEQVIDREPEVIIDDKREQTAGADKTIDEMKDLNILSTMLGFEHGFIESGGNAAGAAGSSDKGLNNAILLGSLIDGTVDTIVLCARPIGGSSVVDAEGSMVWRELV